MWGWGDRYLIMALGRLPLFSAQIISYPTLQLRAIAKSSLGATIIVARVA